MRATSCMMGQLNSILIDVVLWILLEGGGGDLTNENTLMGFTHLGGQRSQRQNSSTLSEINHSQARNLIISSNVGKIYDCELVKFIFNRFSRSIQFV
jgi:hypothetical protein